MKHSENLPMRLFSFLLLLSIPVLSGTTPALAATKCGKTLDTAETLDCLNRETQQVQDALGEAFRIVLEAQDEEKRALLNQAQKDWIVYRDSQCKWESTLADNPALTRVYELSCLKSLTEIRTSVLKQIDKEEKSNAPREFGEQPRWMSVLASDYPDIYWRYGEGQSLDLDCDGENEEVMMGIAVNQVRDALVLEPDKALEKGHNEIEIVVAIAENPQTGKPSAQIVRLPVHESEADKKPHLCRPSVILSIMESPAENGKESACTRELQASDGQCPPVGIYRDGETYKIRPAPAKGE